VISPQWPRRGWELVVVDSAEVDDDLVRGVMLTSMCARLYGRRAAANRAIRAVHATVADGEAA
jgi:predicted site-specific integrase-resolvase